VCGNKPHLEINNRSFFHDLGSEHSLLQCDCVLGELYWHNILANENILMLQSTCSL